MYDETDSRFSGLMDFGTGVFPEHFLPETADSNFYNILHFTKIGCQDFLDKKTVDKPYPSWITIFL